MCERECVRERVCERERVPKYRGTSLIRKHYPPKTIIGP